MSLPIVQVDAFTDRPFAGNPAAVCVLPVARDAAWMQAVALEMNLSETAFLVRRPDGSFDLRWFTPQVEVPLCGHATLASAHVLWQDGHLAPGEQARFHTKSGLLTADPCDGWIEMDFPAIHGEAADPPPELLQALGVAALEVERAPTRWLVQVDGANTVRALAPDFGLLATLPVQGAVVTSRGDNGYDFVSRYFAPRVGINEDPVTGGAHCQLTPYWAARLGKNQMSAFQASARGGELRVRLDGDRVKLSGKAVTVLRGELLTD